MSQVNEVRRVVVEALAGGAPAHEVVEGILKRSGAKPVRRVRRSLEAFRGGDLKGGLSALGCGSLEVAVIVAEPGAAARVEDRLARLPAWFTFAQELGGTAVYAVGLLLMSYMASWAGARTLASATGGATTSLAFPLIFSAAGIVLTELLLVRTPWLTLRLARAAAVASASTHPGSSPASAVALVDAAVGGALSRHLGALERLDAATLDRFEAALLARYESETARAGVAMHVIGLALAALPAVWILIGTYGLVGSLAGGSLR